MRTIETSQLSGMDGTLRLEIPVDKPGHNYRVVVVLSDDELKSDAGADWPEGYFDSVIGKWEGDFERTPEGIVEAREPL